MDTKDVICSLRNKSGLTQAALAEKVSVSPHTVARWETGETAPDADELKLLSKLFGVSVNTLLGEPRKLICQCCGMPMQDDALGHNKDGSLNEDYCKWCYADGTYTYTDLDELVEVCVGFLANEQFPAEQVRAYMKQLLPTLAYWKNRK